MQHFACHLDPVVQEGCLHLRGHGAFELEVAVAPMVRVLRVTGPLRRDTYAARKGDTAIHDQQFSMGAVVQLTQARPMRRVELADLHTCG